MAIAITCLPLFPYIALLEVGCKTRAGTGHMVRWLCRSLEEIIVPDAHQQCKNDWNVFFKRVERKCSSIACKPSSNVSNSSMPIVAIESPIEELKEYLPPTQSQKGTYYQEGYRIFSSFSLVDTAIQMFRIFLLCFTNHDTLSIGQSSLCSKCFP